MQYQRVVQSRQQVAHMDVVTRLVSLCMQGVTSKCCDWLTVMLRLVMMAL